MPHRPDTSVFGRRSRHEVLVAVTDAGSLNGADRLPGTERSNLSCVIERLEQDAGVELFERHPGGLRLTAAGGTAVHHARMVLRQMDAADSALARPRETLDKLARGQRQAFPYPMTMRAAAALAPAILLAACASRAPPAETAE